MDNNSTKKGLGAVIALAVVILIVVTIATVAIVSVIKDNGGVKKNEDTSLYSLAGVTNPPKETFDNKFFDMDETENNEDALQTPENAGNSAQIFVDVEAGDNGTKETTKKNNNEYNPIQEYEKLTKNGENQLSDHHNNKYIKLVSEKFNVDTELLVAIYSEPNTGNNFVLEFSGKRNEDGNVIKSPDTLVKVYQIDKSKNITVATGKTTGNVGVSYAEGTLCFNMVKSIVMPQYPDYFTGVEK